MFKTSLLALTGILTTSGVLAQMKKQFTVEKNQSCETVNLCLKAKTGNCFVRPGQTDEILSIFSNQDLEEYAHTFSNEVKNAVCFVNLALEQEGHRGVGQKISYQVFGGTEEVHDKFWKVYLTDTKPYALDFDYGLGNANIDLSGLAIKKLKINTGSADVNVSYATGAMNQVEMDTFFVKVDLGSLNVRQLNLSRSHVVMAEVGFGNILLDFSNRADHKPDFMPVVQGSVGAGNMVIFLPEETVPVLVHINESWLCSVNLSRSLHRVGENSYANNAYAHNPKNALTFDLDVSMGKIIFREKSN
ncbi:MAG TPA: hypothetical protein PK059_07775 [Cyclobacteriaceae bacterium]|nr:hypothetical protein [Cyclobacteriaceae bacterium]